MFAGSRRFLVITALLLVAVGLTRLRDQRSSRQMPVLAPTSGTDSPPPFGNEKYVKSDISSPDSGVEPTFVYFVDVEGWYRITSYERAVRSIYDLTGATTASVAQALPSTLGEWRQLGSDRHIGDDPSVIYYLKSPTVALERTYEDRNGKAVSLTLIGNQGDDSFLLFSHTPETCYPGRLWQVVDQRLDSLPIDEHSIYAQYLLTEHAETGEKLVVLYWYLWADPERDSKEGVLSMRVNVFVGPDETEAQALSRGWALIRELFPATVPWQRF